MKLWIVVRQPDNMTCQVVTCCVYVQVTPVLFWPWSPSTWCPAVRGPLSSATCSALCSTPSTATPHGRSISVRSTFTEHFPYLTVWMKTLKNINTLIYVTPSYYCAHGFTSPATSEHVLVLAKNVNTHKKDFDCGLKLLSILHTPTTNRKTERHTQIKTETSNLNKNPLNKQHWPTV